jgi:hypothetical protein
MTIKQNYVCIPRALLRSPPIRHRHTPDDDSSITPFECAVMAGLLLAARNRLDRTRRREARKAGKQAISLEKTYANDHQKEWRIAHKLRRLGQHAEAPERYHTYKFDPDQGKGNPGKIVKHAGSVAYKQRLKELRKTAPPDEIKLVLTGYDMLQRARLSNKGQNHTKLEAALNRLRQPVGDDALATSLVLDWKRLKSKKFFIMVSGEWLQPPYGRLALPLPIQSPTALTLLLWLRTTRTSAMSRGKISFHNLCGLLGLSPTARQHRLSSYLNTALDTVNDYLSNIDAKLADKLNLPGCYEIKSIDDGAYVQFIGRQRPEPDDDDDETLEERPKLRMREERPKPDLREERPRLKLKFLYDENGEFAGFG